MEKLKSIISKYNNWAPLEESIARIETYRDTDYSIAFENAKSLLETIGKEICTKKDQPLNDNSPMNGVLKNAFRVMGYVGDHHITQISTSLANIGQNVGNLRNNIGATSHGKTLEQMEKRNDAIDDLSKFFLLDSVEIIACFMIRLFEGENSQLQPKIQALKYLDCEEFNDFWDESYGEFEMGDYSFTASEILYNNDHNLYTAEYDTYKELMNNEIKTQ